MVRCVSRFARKWRIWGRPPRSGFSLQKAWVSGGFLSKSTKIGSPQKDTSRWNSTGPWEGQHETRAGRIADPFPFFASCQVGFRGFHQRPFQPAKFSFAKGESNRSVFVSVEPKWHLKQFVDIGEIPNCTKICFTPF